MMFALTGWVMALTTVLYGWRMGEVLSSIGRVEQSARGFIGLLLASLALGFFQRSGEVTADFRWFHWLILAAGLGTAVSYCALLWRAHFSRP